ncbi:MAG: helix-turn-helix domain-containing protein [Bifidobacteriaceae bacterium]|jgi:excisionase family DNA binding protein|nr:helix-turn-helix domain-containing protein [Bifidobacteriaceae bacterium]
MENFRNRRFISTSDACKILGFSRPTLLSYVKDGILRAYHIKYKNSLRFDIEDLENLLEPIEVVE